MTKPLNIGIDLRALTHGITSGVTTYIYEVVRALLTLDQKNHYFLWWNSRHHTIGFAKELQRKNSTCVATQYSNTSLNLTLSMSHRPCLDQLILKAAGAPDTALDVLWLPDPRPVGVSPSCRIVTTIHDLSPTKCADFFSLKTRAFHLLTNPAQLARMSDHVLTVSQATRGDLMHDWRVHKKNITVTPLGTRADFQRVTSPTKLSHVRKKYQLPARFILALGTLEPRKNLMTLIEAFTILQTTTQLPHQLVIAGSSQPQIFSHFSVKNKQLPKTIHFPGFIAESDKAALMSAADLFVAPSLYEGFDLPLLEALKIGIPIVASDIAVHREVAGQAATFVDPQSPMQFAMAMSNTLTRKKTQSKQGQIIAKKLTWRKTAEATLKVLTTH